MKAADNSQAENFERLFRAVISVPKSEVEKLEAKERSKNRRKRSRRKKAAAKPHP